MGPFDFTLLILASVILGASLLYTFSVGRRRYAHPTEHDSEVDKDVRDHYATRNPVFLAYIIAAVLALLYIAYAAMRLGTY